MHVFRKVPRVAGTVKAAVLARAKSTTVYRTRENIYLQQKKKKLEQAAKEKTVVQG